MKIIKNNGQYRITLPKDLVIDKGWDENTELRFVEDLEGRVFLKVIDPKKVTRIKNQEERKRRKKNKKGTGRGDNQ